MFVKFGMFTFSLSWAIYRIVFSFFSVLRYSQWSVSEGSSYV